MAAIPRVLISTISRNILVAQQLKTQTQLSPKLYAGISTAACNYSSYRSSRPVRELNEYPEVEVVHNPPEWIFVERLLPSPTVPKPLVKAQYPSGWRPQAPVDAEKQKYYVARTKNYMVPVYLHTRFRGLRRITVVRLVQGDIWALEQDLRAVVEKARNGKVCATRVNEMSGQVHIHGDYVDEVREYLKQRGF